jgi:alkylation response protein AidB-like acyl-CoA dehydrogenase
MIETRVRGGGFLYAPPDPGDVFVPEDLDSTQRQVGESARDYVRREVTPAIDDLERHDWQRSRELLRKAGELGLTAIEVPPAFGGLGLDKITASVVAQELGAAASFAVTFMVHAGIGMLPIVYFGTPDQKQRYLPSLVSAERVAAYSLTEAGSGSDALGARTVARLTPDGTAYVLNGSKQWTSNAGLADVYVVFAKVDGQQFTAFLVDRDTPGVEIGAEENKMGLHGSSTATVTLRDVHVPVENVLHFVGKGHQVAFNMLNLGRFKLGAVCLGGCRHLLGASTRYALERQQFARPIAAFPLIQQNLAGMAARTYAVESMVYRIAGSLDQSLASLDLEGDAREASASALAEYAIECSIAKVFASEALSSVVDEGVQIHGGYGFMHGFDVERAYRDTRINRIFEGTNEINRLLIPQTLFRRVRRAELPPPDVAAIGERMTAGAVMAPTGELAGETWLVETTRTLFWHIAGLAQAKYGDQIEQEQEALADLADLAIQLFAVESATVRAQRAAEAQLESQSLQRDLAKSVAVTAVPLVVTSARRALARVANPRERGAALTRIAAIGSLTDIDSIDLGRRIATQVIQAEGWPLQ